MYRTRHTQFSHERYQQDIDGDGLSLSIRTFADHRAEHLRRVSLA
jgi:hypothetical protein